MIGRAFLSRLCTLLAFTAPLALAASDPVPAQKPLILVNGTFQFISGAWASYDITDKAKNETSRMWIAVLERTSKKKDKKKIPHAWMEIEVEAPDSPPVVTRILA